MDVAKRQVGAGDVDGLINETLYRIYAKIPPEWRIRTEADVKRTRMEPITDDDVAQGWRFILSFA